MFFPLFQGSIRVQSLFITMEAKSHFTRKNQGAFTLIELLTVIAVIAVLTAILVPASNKVLEKSRKSLSSSNLRQISLAYYSYALESREPRPLQEKTLQGWARTLAQHADLNDPSIWIVKGDPLLEREDYKIPSTLAEPDASGRWQVSEDFAKIPLSYTIANGLSLRAPASTTPIAWTRGLKANGQWSKTSDECPGVFGDTGGFIAFLDGHVVWYEDLSTNGGQLIHYVTKRPTANIYEAISPGASILDYRGPVPYTASL